MTWFEDLTPYTYLRFGRTTPPTLNVGWLSPEHEFAKGNVPPRFVARLQELCIHARTQQTRGLHPCELCPDLRTFDNHLSAEDIRLSSCEVRAVGVDGTRYAAPRLIFHYVTAHGYAPPNVFIEAVLRMETLTWQHAAANQLCMGCGTKLVQQRAMAHPRAASSAPPPPLIPYFSCPGCATSYWRRPQSIDALPP